MIQLKQITFKIPAGAEEKVRMMAMVAMERHLRALRAAEISAIEASIKTDLEEIKQANGIEEIE